MKFKRMRTTSELIKKPTVSVHFHSFISFSVATWLIIKLLYYVTTQFNIDMFSLVFNLKHLHFHAQFH